MTALDAEEILWEEICCPLCSNGDEDLLMAVPAEPAETLYRLVRCRHCGMVYVNPRPAPSPAPQHTLSLAEPISSPCCDVAELAEGASASPTLSMAAGTPFAPARQSATVWGRFRLWLERLVLSCFHGYPPPRTRWWEKLLATLARPLVGPGFNSLMPLPYIGEGRLVDYGCCLPMPAGRNSGRLGRQPQQRGWNVLTLDDRSGPSPLPAIAPASVDAIVMEWVLGLLHWPHPVIEQATQALRPGGLLAISVPNLDSWGFRTFGMKWFPLEVPRRLLYFTPATLERLVAMHGLEVLEVRYLGRTSWMRRSMQNQFYPGLFAGLLTRWTVWRKQADSLLMLARRPQTGVAGLRAA